MPETAWNIPRCDAAKSSNDESDRVVHGRIHSYTARTGHGILRIAYGLSTITGQRPHFTITAYAHDTRDDSESWGQLHDEIMQYAPRFKPLIDLHLADVDGTPLYALENGWYWYTLPDEDEHVRQAYPDTTNAERAARYLRTTPETFKGVETKEQFAQIVESLKPQWKHEADAAIEKFDLI